MRRSLPCLAACLALGCAMVADARVVRPAPDFTWTDYNGKAMSLASLKGQPVVLIIAPSPTDRTFRAQIGQLQKAYQRFAAAKLVCFAAFTSEGGTVKSNIPFIVAPDGPRVAFLYDVPAGFAIAVIGPDGNLDCLWRKVLPAQRILDIMDNNYEVQRGFRSEHLGSIPID